MTALDQPARSSMANEEPAKGARPPGAARPEVTRQAGPRRAVTRWSPVVAAIAAAVLATIWWRGLPPSATVTDVRAELVIAAGGWRPIEPRLSGGFAHASLVVRRAGDQPAPPDVAIAAARLRKLASAESSRGVLSALGVAELLGGRSNEAIRLLTEAQRVGADEDPRVWSDLGAAYLERARQNPERRAEDVARALDATGRATLGDPRLAEGWFNLALAREQLALRPAAADAWRRYLALERNPAWRAEGEPHLSKASALDAASGTVADLERLAAPGGDSTALASFARQHPQLLREWLEERQLPAWGRAALDGDERVARACLDAASRVVQAARPAASADRLAGDMLTAINRAWPAAPEAWRALALGHASYGSGRALFEQSRDGAAGEQFDIAARALSVTTSPLRLLAGLQQALITYQARDLRGVRVRVRPVLTAALARGYPTVAARAQHLLALTDTQAGDLDAAIHEYREAIVAFRRAGERESAASAGYASANGQRILGDSAGGWQSMTEALGELDALQNLRRRYMVLYNASMFSLREDLPVAALDFQNAALSTARTRGVPGAIVEGLVRRGAIRSRLGDHEGARADLGEARSRLAGVDDPGRHAYYAALLAAVDGAARSRSSPSDASTMLAEAMAYFDVSEPMDVPRLALLRARAARVLGDLDGAEVSLQRGVVSFEELRARLTSEQNRTLYVDDAWELFTEMVDIQVAGRRRPDLGFAYAERGRARGLEARERAMPADVHTVARDVPADAMLVSYIVLADRTCVWAVRHNRVDFVELPIDGARLSALVQAQRQALTSATDRGEGLESSAKLYDAVMRPLLGREPAPRALIIVPDGRLHEVSFASLYDRDAGRFLIERVDIAVAPSARLYLESRRRQERLARAGAPRRALLVASPTAGEAGLTLPTLLDAEREIDEIGRLYEEPRPLKGAAVSKPVLLDALPNYDVVHFAGHAVANDDYPFYSRLLLGTASGQSTSVYAYELSGLSLPRVRSVVLAACSTARGRLVRGEGPGSLARPFLRAGVPSVLASLWDVDDRGTRALLVEFHRQLASGVAPASALRRAQIALLHGSDRSLRAPSYWAAFVNIGAA
jgi:CHAT domain-containing protein/tetratricopeptide (TPR) repeat protein